MTLLELLGALRKARIELRPQGDMLRYRPASRVTGPIQEALARHKQILLGALDGRGVGYAGPKDAPVPGEWVQTPSGVGELVGWAENGEALVYLFRSPEQAGHSHRVIWVQADALVGELDWSASA